MSVLSSEEDAALQKSLATVAREATALPDGQKPIPFTRTLEKVISGSIAVFSKTMLVSARRYTDALQAAILPRIDEQSGKLAEHDTKLDSLERRASRHADHLARLESRLRALETK
jgi:hypothetical protein